MRQRPDRSCMLHTGTKGPLCSFHSHFHRDADHTWKTATLRWRISMETPRSRFTVCSMATEATAQQSKQQWHSKRMNGWSVMFTLCFCVRLPLCSYCVQAMCQNVIREPSFAKDPVAALKKGFLRTDQEVTTAAASPVICSCVVSLTLFVLTNMDSTCAHSICKSRTERTRRMERLPSRCSHRATTFSLRMLEIRVRF